MNTSSANRCAAVKKDSENCTLYAFQSPPVRVSISTWCCTFFLFPRVAFATQFFIYFNNLDGFVIIQIFFYFTSSFCYAMSPVNLVATFIYFRHYYRSYRTRDTTTGSTQFSLYFIYYRQYFTGTYLAVRYIQVVHRVCTVEVLCCMQYPPG